VLAPESIRGEHLFRRVGVLPELRISLRRRLTPDFLLSVGYTLTYLDHAIRVADLIHPELSASQLERVRSPLEAAESETEATSLKQPAQSGLWVQGVQIGLEW
jgi:hypothetical protein